MYNIQLAAYRQQFLSYHTSIAVIHNLFVPKTCRSRPRILSADADNVPVFEK